MSEPTEQSRWYAEVKFLGTLTEDQLVELCHPHTGVATMGSTGIDGVTTLKFVVDAADISSAFMIIRSKLMVGLLHRLIFLNNALSYPVAFEIMDEARRDARINVEFGLPADTPAAGTGRILLDRIAQAPAATDEDRARWAGPVDMPFVPAEPQGADEVRRHPLVQRAEAAAAAIKAELEADRG